MNASTVLKEWLYFVSFIVFVGYMTGCQKSVVEQTALSQQIVIQGQVFVVTKSRENIKLGGETVLLFSRDAREQSAQWCAWSNQLVEAQNKVEATLRLPAVPTPTSITLTKLQTALQIHKEKSLNSDISLTELETEGEWIIKLTAAIDDLKIKIAEECPIFKAMDERDHLFNSLNWPDKYGLYAAFGQPLEETITDADGRFKMTVERSTNSMYVVVCTERQIGDKEEKYLWIESVGDYGYIPVGQQSVDVILSNQNK